MQGPLPQRSAGSWELRVFIGTDPRHRAPNGPLGDDPRQSRHHAERELAMMVASARAYRVVRNPMFVANVAIILGSGAVFGVWELVAWAAVVLVAFHLFAVIYEEPTLEPIFGGDYEDYRRDVGRWVPRRLGVVVPRRDERA